LLAKLKNNATLWGVLGTLLFIALNAFFYTKQNFLFNALPIAVAVLLLALYRYDVLLYLVVFATPLSFNFENLAVGGVGFYFPTEPLLFGLFLLYIIQTFRKVPTTKSFSVHIISIIIIIQLFWLIICAFASTMPMVSFKFLLSRMWFVVALYFLVANILVQRKNIEKLIWLYVIPLCGVVIYTVIRHAGYSFDQETAHWVMSPFYKDHTSYGAVLAMYVPVVMLLFFKGKYNLLKRSLIGTALAILVLGTVLSYTRAAWLSLAGAAVVYVIMRLRIKFSVVAGLAVTLIGLFLIYQNTIFDALEKNQQDSSDNLSEHVESMSNISSDASNLERLNRWSSAIRMFAEKPVFGFGPGTYQFKYAPYQLGSEKTIISTNFGDVGNAHSEYLGPLAEQGLLGMLLMLALVVGIIIVGVRVYTNEYDEHSKLIAMGLLLGLITYFAHGFLNNYLDTDKASVPVWTFIASIVVLDISHRNSKRTAIKA